MTAPAVMLMPPAPLVRTLASAALVALERVNALSAAPAPTAPPTLTAPWPAVKVSVRLVPSELIVRSTGVWAGAGRPGFAAIVNRVIPNRANMLSLLLSCKSPRRTALWFDCRCGES